MLDGRAVEGWLLVCPVSLLLPACLPEGPCLSAAACLPGWQEGVSMSLC